MKRFLLVCALALAAAIPASANEGLVASREFSFTPGNRADAVPTLRVLAGSSLTLVNLGNIEHNVRSDGFVGATTTRLFESDVIGSRQTAPVARVGSLPPGTYDFHCAIHPLQMRGRLVVL